MGEFIQIMFEKEKQRRIIKKLAVIIPFIMLMVVLAACSTESITTNEKDSSSAGTTIETNHNPVNGMVQSDDGGSVTIDIEWIGVENDSLVLNVAMNTHSVDLDGFDLMELAVMRDDEGNLYNPVLWDAGTGGHHRSGTLSFPVPASLDQGTTDYIEILIREIADIDERVLKWDLQ